MEAINLGGRPAHYETPEELKAKVDEYFNPKTCPDFRYISRVETIDGKREEYQERVPHYTKTGLALFLGFADRRSLYDYGKREEFSHIIKSATTRVEQGYEMMLAEKGVATGAIFALKNMGWKDRTDVTSGDEPLKQSVAIVPDRKSAEEWGKE